MKKFKYSKPTRISEVSFDDLFEDSGNWQLKAERLLRRREKQLKLQQF